VKPSRRSPLATYSTKPKKVWLVRREEEKAGSEGEK